LGPSNEEPGKAPFGSGGTRTTSSLVIASRLVLLLLAGVATIAAFALSRGRDGAAERSAVLFVCPMHPEVISKGPSECPICRMALEQVRPPVAPAEAINPQEHKVVGTATRRPFTLELRAPAWIEAPDRVSAVLYQHDISELSSEEPGLFFRTDAPTVGIPVRRSSEPPVAWDRSTLRVRFRAGAGAPKLEEGAAGWVKLAAKTREYLVVPSSAVLYSAEGPHVLVPGESGATFDKRRVEIGRVFGGLAVVLSGVRDGEPIAQSSTFFLDAERRLQSQREDKR